jgi:hypothetical protein
MIITKEQNENINQFKDRLIKEIEFGNITAEDAFDAYEEAFLKNIE